jgi:hypothetical protein
MRWVRMGVGEHEMEDGALLIVAPVTDHGVEHVRLNRPERTLEISVRDRETIETVQRWPGGERMVARFHGEVLHAEATPYFARERTYSPGEAEVEIILSERAFAIGTHDFYHTTHVLTCGATVRYDDLGTHWQAAA